MKADRLERRKGLARTLKRAKAGEEISLEQLAHLWRVTKARFVNVKREIADFPDPSSKDQKTGALNYPAEAALQALIAWEHRDDRLQAAKAEQQRRLMGIPDPEEVTENDMLLPPSELLKYANLHTTLEKQQVDQNNLLKAQIVAAEVGGVFSTISAYIGSLANSIDPNGLFDADLRASLDKGGRDLLFTIHADLKRLLAAGDNQSETVPAHEISDRPRSKRRRANTG